MVVMTDIVAALPLPALAPDDPRQLAAVIVDAADIHYGEIRRRRGFVNGAAEPVLDLAVADPPPHRKPRVQHVPRRGDRDHDDVGIGGTYCGNDGAGGVGDDGAAGAELIIDRARQGVT